VKRILLAPDSFKESMSGSEAAAAMSLGVANACLRWRTIQAPVSDGGEGVGRLLTAALGGVTRAVKTIDPLGRPILASYGWVEDRSLAIVEAATSIGLDLLAPAERNAGRANSAGFGRVLMAVLNQGAKHVIAGLGGSAANDAGAGALTELGVRLIDHSGKVSRPLPGTLAGVAAIDVSGLDPRWRAVTVDLAADVTNRLCGPDGASAVFGPQKGVDAASIWRYDRAFAHFAAVASQVRVASLDLARRPGAGAAGGLGWALATFLDGQLTPGFDLVWRSLSLDEALAEADLVFTGEGRLDRQTVNGKAPAGVAARARAEGLPVVAFAGKVEGSAASALGDTFDLVVEITPPGQTRDQALRTARANLARAAESVCRQIELDPKGWRSHV
jgi:glycerate kinase